MTHAFSAVALAPGEIDRAYPLVAALESGRLTPARWRAATEAWIRSGGGETPARRGIMTLRNGRGTFHALFFFEVSDEEEDGGGGGPVLAVSRLRFIELAGAHQTLREILAAIDRLAAARGCREVRVAMGDDADAPRRGAGGSSGPCSSSSPDATTGRARPCCPGPVPAAVTRG